MSTRRKFIRDLAAAAGSGLAILLIPSSANSAERTLNCCPSGGCPSCAVPKRPFYCRCPTGDYCTCVALNVCYSGPC
jgi:hypothetical protein